PLSSRLSILQTLTRYILYTTLFRSKNGDQKVYDITPSDKVVDVTGAGDSFSSAIIFGWLKGYSVDDIVKMAMANSRKTIETPFTDRKSTRLNSSHVSISYAVSFLKQ